MGTFLLVRSDEPIVLNDTHNIYLHDKTMSSLSNHISREYIYIFFSSLICLYINDDFDHASTIRKVASSLVTMNESTQQIRINGMTCGNCVRNIENALNEVPAIKSIHVSENKKSEAIENLQLIAHFSGLVRE